MSLLEVITQTEADAEAAEAGGADRIEVVADVRAGGLSPDPCTVAVVRRATSLPMRVMLRAKTGFRTTGPELDRLRRAAGEHAECGADGFVFGFLSATGTVDVAATMKLADAVAPLPWTFHRAVDNAACLDSAWAAIADLPGLDAVLSAGSPRGVEAGMAVLLRRTASHASLVLAGGGLRRKHVAVLVAAGVDAFHVGAAVRRAGVSGVNTVDAALVRDWRTLVDASPCV
ncbi:copper homeostasis protein CutC [Actinomadura sp. DC4]|uniref:copper homeostasis protein CutC n=1 Tax=Actinomadura sp. DC4 TaxID=3055069 RepID=UPI0025B0137A|nr:copper homeostasis protein CutC [Actinomadura sp. DC4]MDN3353194.1 copper homeostasis protein CutC [Actinomadura sp. DC4]